MWRDDGGDGPVICSALLLVSFSVVSAASRASWMYIVLARADHKRSAFVTRRERRDRKGIVLGRDECQSVEVHFVQHGPSGKESSLLSRIGRDGFDGTRVRHESVSACPTLGSRSQKTGSAVSDEASGRREIVDHDAAHRRGMK